jgi:hypothetical protein
MLPETDERFASVDRRPEADAWERDREVLFKDTTPPRVGVEWFTSFAAGHPIAIFRPDDI